MSLPTASALARAIACPMSEALPHVKGTSANADAGNVRHAYVQAIGEVGAEAALAAVPQEHRAMCEAIDHESLPTSMAAEVAFAWDSVTLEAREIGRDIGRNYQAGPNEVCGTVDVLGVSDDAVYICDYKGYEYVSIRDNPQLLFGALCAAKVYSKERAILDIRHLLRPNDRGQRCEVDVFDLGMFEDKLVGAVARIRSTKQQPIDSLVAVEGEHCKYCPAFDSCPAKTKLMRAMINGDEATRVEMTVPLSPETALIAYQQLRAMEALVKRARDIVYGYASQHPIPLGDGRVFGARTKPGNEKLDGDVVYNVLRAQVGQDAADLGVERKATKTGIARAVKHAKAQGVATGTLKAITGAIMEGVVSQGGIERKPTTTIDEHKAELSA